MRWPSWNGLEPFSIFNDLTGAPWTCTIEVKERTGSSSNRGPGEKLLLRPTRASTAEAGGEKCVCVDDRRVPAALGSTQEEIGDWVSLGWYAAMLSRQEL